MDVLFDCVFLVATACAASGATAAWIRRRHRQAASRQSADDNVFDVRAVFDQMTDGVSILDMRGNLLVMNCALADALEIESRPYTREELTNLLELLTPEGDVLPVEEWPALRALRGDYVQAMPLQTRRRDTGRTRSAIYTTAPIKDHSGAVVQILLIWRDITERILLDTLRTQMVAIVESSEDAIVGKDVNGIVTSWNRGAEKIFGYTSEEMIGESIKRLLPPDRQTEEDAILARIRRGETVDHIETTRIRKDGSTILISLTISPIRDTRGKIVGASKVARDITQLRRTERQKQQSQKMEAIGQLTGGIAHDFNNLLAVVLGNLDLMEALLHGHAAALRRLETAQKAAMRGADLTRRLLAFSSNEELNPKLTDLGHSIRNTLELAQRALGPEITVVADLDRAMPSILIDVAGLETLLLNLILNARDAMPEGGMLTVSSQLVMISEENPVAPAVDLKPGGYARVTVSDTGHGMSRETMERAFEPFYTTKVRGRGTGLGLAMAYGFVKQSGGTVRLYSELGHGTSVSFYLPVPESLPESGEVKKTGAAQGSGPQAGTVLVVDDEADLLEIASMYLTQMGYTALTAMDGPSALELLAQSPDVDLMITDFIMPGGMSGAALAKHVRALRPEIKIIYCSGFPADALAERGSFPVEGPMLRKPYQRDEFQGMVRDALNPGNSSAEVGS